MRVLDLDSQYWSGQIQNIESLKRLYSVRWGGNKWPRRPLGVNYSMEAWVHCVKVGLVVLLLKRELDSLKECLRWWWSEWPPLLVNMWVIPEDLGNFSPKKGEKSWGAKIRTSCRIFFKLGFFFCFFNRIFSKSLTKFLAVSCCVLSWDGHKAVNIVVKLSFSSIPFLKWTQVFENWGWHGH